MQQGDLLSISKELREVLQEFHPYYANHTDYKLLIVLTQSCDLVIRNNQGCKSKYITLAAVRPAETALLRELSKFQHSTLERKGRLCGLQYKSYAKQFIEALLNNNQPDYFYLERDAALGLSEPMTAFLALSVTLKSNEHYSKCIQARIGQLKPVFQAKLGWLVGNMYSRVGTEDWVPDNCDAEKFKEKVEGILGQLLVWCDRGAITFLDKTQKQERRQHGQAFELSENQIERLLEDYNRQRRSQYIEFAEAVVDHVKEIIGELDEKQIEQLKTRLQNASDIEQFLRRK